MSALVVVKKSGKVVIAADSLTTFGRTKFNRKYQRHSEKIHRFENCYIGIVGDAAHSNVFENILEHYGEELKFDSRKHIFETYLRLHELLKDKFHLNPAAADDMAYQSSQIDALIANEHGIFGMFEFREVHEFEKFWAIGSGKPYALGAMFSAFDRFEDPEEIAKVGILASCEFDNACDLPMNLYSLQLQKTDALESTEDIPILKTG
ncbi:MAG TPA: MFS transporter [Verrucomicrobiae bacterium]|jgi:ATP-dependent protease HslVU (ClpYQ) peptidase subunit